ncbi:MAG TPA: glycosyltransferase [Segetibacter sp.]
MISVIVCSRSLAFFEALQTNIKNTIGVPFEITRIDNENNTYGICKAYNEGAALAKFSYLCFVHEDVFFQTNNWGSNLVNHFVEDKEVGLIGIAGAVYKTKMSSGWWHTESGWQEARRMNLVQHHKNIHKPTQLITINPFKESRSQVVSIDGVFMVTKKEDWLQNKFDEKLLKGFHGYDLDFSLHVGQHKKVVVVYDVLIDHFSGGSYDLDWMKGIMMVHKKWRKHLPVIIKECDPTAKSIYANGWKRLRKNIAFIIEQKPTFLFVLESYHFLFTLLDKKPGKLQTSKDYFRELYKTISLFKRSRRSVQ